MSVPSKQEMLQKVEIAISALSEGAESYSIGGKTMKHHQISELTKWRKQLINEIAADRNNTTYAKFTDPA